MDKVIGFSFLAGGAVVAIFGELDIENLIGSVGFPIAVASYLLVVMRKEMVEVRKAVIRLARAMEKANGIEPGGD